MTKFPTTSVTQYRLEFFMNEKYVPKNMGG